MYSGSDDGKVLQNEVAHEKTLKIELGGGAADTDGEREFWSESEPEDNDGSKLSGGDWSTVRLEYHHSLRTLCSDAGMAHGGALIQF